MSDIEPLVDNKDVLRVLFGKEKPPQWLIPDVAAQGAVICLAADSNIGKSFLSYYIALALACGFRALGGIIPAGPPKRVLYYDEENSEQDRNKYLRQALNGLIAENEGEEPDPMLFAENLWLTMNRLGVDNWADIVAMDIEQVQPAAVMYDTSTPAFDIQDENDNAEASRTVKQLKQLARLTEPPNTQWVERHAKVGLDANNKRTMRGAKTWRNQADGVIFFVRAKGRPKDGLHTTLLLKDKKRAYGLKGPIRVKPTWTDSRHSGLKLHATWDIEERADDDAE